jgi:release factor glutamine methyltransferase
MDNQRDTVRSDEPPVNNQPSTSGDSADWTVGGLLSWTAGYLAQKGVEFPRLDTEVLLAHALDCRRIDLYGERHGQIASEPVRRQFRELIRRRLEGCPVAYLVGHKEFFSVGLEVSPAVLIPRPDTELVVVECLNLAKKLPAPLILDIGTGSGNVAIAVARQHPGAGVTATDLSPEALDVARHNAERVGLAGRIRFLQGDLFAPVPVHERFDFVLSNPPYIATEDLDRLPDGVRNYEPRMALDGGPGGFTVFDRLVDGALALLSRGGYLMVEIGSPQEQPARQRIMGFSEYDLAETIHDASGHPRVLRARRK